jgi:hypothetical protein
LFWCDSQSIEQAWCDPGHAFKAVLSGEHLLAWLSIIYTALVEVSGTVTGLRALLHTAFNAGH